MAWTGSNKGAWELIRLQRIEAAAKAFLADARVCRQMPEAEQFHNPFIQTLDDAVKSKP